MAVLDMWVFDDLVSCLFMAFGSDEFLQSNDGTDDECDFTCKKRNLLASEAERASLLTDNQSFSSDNGD